MRKILIGLFFFLGLASIKSFATHNRAGEISYEHVSGFTYRITVTTYTDLQSFTADRCELEVFFGDGSSTFLPRVNGSPCTGNFPQCLHCGDAISLGVSGTKLNQYVGEHTFPGTGSYRITMEDPNRNSGVVNIPNSIDVVFFVYAELIIFPSGVPNSSPYLHYPPIDNGCLNELYKHNPGAVDQDISNNGESDSLSYSLVACLGNGGATIPSYTLPDQWPAGPNNNITIDPVTGTIIWDSPKIAGEYNVAILIEEWRRFGNNKIKVGSILRDLQITIASCTENSPPHIVPINDTCVTATEVLLKSITALDNDFIQGQYQRVELQAKGDPFEVQGNQATFPRKSDEREVTQEFRWATQCNHIRAYPYFVVFRAGDNGAPVNLVDYLDWRIEVNGPAPTDVSSQAEGSSIRVSWGYNTCTNASGYRVYRKLDSIGYVAPNCETGIPASTGYQLVGSTVGPSSTTFVDDGNGKGLTIGLKYCYMVYAYFEDGAESYPSLETCASLRKEVPIITRVSVNNTNTTSGSDTIKWAKPMEVDSNLFPGPYGYKVLRGSVSASFTEVFVSSLNFDLNVIDTVFIDSNLNTTDIQYRYKIELYSGSDLVGPSSVATSPYLHTQPLDNRLKLTLDIDVPWKNEQMIIFKEDGNGHFNFLDTAYQMNYTDSFLINGNEYCYYITTVGEYHDNSIESPLLNNSQIICGTPKDEQAPCGPEELDIDSSCELFYNDLSWLNPNDICDTTDDVVSYNIYFRPFEEGESQIITTVNGAENTSIQFTELESVAGCYNVSAVDSFNNESELSNTVCVDNCPYYELPNIFTPGKDGYNDYFVPLKGWRYVQEVDMHVYNRWGEELYTTKDPGLGWNGNTNEDVVVTNGVYFYVCTVYEIRLSGIVERVLKGTVTLLREESGEPSN